MTSFFLLAEIFCFVTAEGFGHNLTAHCKLPLAEELKSEPGAGYLYQERTYLGKGEWERKSGTIALKV